eukprot:s4534_g1.t1
MSLQEIPSMMQQSSTSRGSCATTRSRQALRLDQKDEVALLTAASIEAERMPRVFRCNSCKDTSLKTLPSSSTSYQSMIWRTFNNTLARKQRRKRLLPLLRRAVDSMVTPRAEVKGALALQLGGTKEAVKLWKEAMSLKPSRAMVNKAIMQMTFLARHDLADAFKQFSVKEAPRRLGENATQRELQKLVQRGALKIIEAVAQAGRYPLKRATNHQPFCLEFNRSKAAEVETLVALGLRPAGRKVDWFTCLHCKSNRRLQKLFQGTDQVRSVGWLATSAGTAIANRALATRAQSFIFE